MSVAIAENKAPGFAKNPDKRIELNREGRRVRVEVGGVIVADSTIAITIYESGGYGPIHYIPAADVRRAFLTPTAKQTYCPYKGHASYWTIEAGGKKLDDAVWSYQAPYDEMLAIGGHIAFYADRVDKISVE